MLLHCLSTAVSTSASKHRTDVRETIVRLWGFSSCTFDLCAAGTLAFRAHMRACVLYMYSTHGSRTHAHHAQMRVYYTRVRAGWRPAKGNRSVAVPVAQVPLLEKLETCCKQREYGAIKDLEQEVFEKYLRFRRADPEVAIIIMQNLAAFTHDQSCSRMEATL
eukprot:Tamp_29828.p1 GENE.Tamp_29828~~Tamp_29828.p1  ORF type:complete len:163 (-),score=13.77 Tamp_29828:169-657(-)